MAPCPRWRVPSHRAEACREYVFIERKTLHLFARPGQYLESALAIAWNYRLDYQQQQRPFPL